MVNFAGWDRNCLGGSYQRLMNEDICILHAYFIDAMSVMERTLDIGVPIYSFILFMLFL